MVDTPAGKLGPTRVLCVALARLIARLCQGTITQIDTAKELDRLARYSAGLTPVKSTETKSTAKEEDEVFEFWKKATGKTKYTFTTDRRLKIRARLKKHTVNEIKQAIEWICNEPFYAGENKDNKVYNDIELICRSDSKLEGYLDRARECGITETKDMVSESKAEALEQAKFDAEKALEDGNSDAYSRAQKKIRNLTLG